MYKNACYTIPGIILNQTKKDACIIYSVVCMSD